MHHTNIVSVFDYGEHDGVCYYAMQYIAGHSLDEILADVRRLRSNPVQEKAAPVEAGPDPNAEAAPGDCLRRSTTRPRPRLRPIP